MSNTVLTDRGEQRTQYIIKHMNTDEYPKGFTIKDIINKAEVGPGKLFVNERQIRDHMRKMTDKLRDLTSEKAFGATTYFFRPNLYEMFHFKKERDKEKKNETS